MPVGHSIKRPEIAAGFTDSQRRAVTKVKRSFVFCRLFCSTPTKRRADWILYSVMMASSGSFFRWLPFSLKYRTSPVHLIYGAAIFVEKKDRNGPSGGSGVAGCLEAKSAEEEKKRETFSALEHL
jgi:hypothetical protein